ncbi:MAG: bifunctional 2-polyprenyl-6-hydroxyphenol methylase/3-demethylubiquinol 3-O-methyltransferase UbiG [Pseudomonadota bacterium]
MTNERREGPMSEAGNIDPGEIAKFDSIASRWWDTEGEFQPLHDINPLRANWIDERAPVVGKRLLDVGCGGGILSEAMAMRGAAVTGIDMAEAALRVAELHQLESGVQVDYRLSTAEQLAESEPAQFDIVCCLEMLEHVPDPDQVVAACAALVKPGGDIFFSTINRNPKSFLFAIIGAERILRLLPTGTHDYRMLIRPSELSQWLRRAGLDLQAMTGLIYNPITKRYRLSESDVSVNYLLHAKRPS